ncbi:hypothetical protein [Ruminococcus sp.]|uniref:hypothetical protein n=1 Tax=Ruminococcus sp. TaxID=41978 RepID=UPI001B6E1F23|nr:hypothetical protein [Ruminococcus sp.]MBP5431067.1 phage tail protein [Ruminococcus sp.]
MAGGSVNDPVIVSTWNQFIVAFQNRTSYIKWADVENKTIDFISITGKISGSCTQCDFNGWTFERVDITDIQDYFVFDSSGQQGMAQAVNLTINKLNVFKSARAAVHIFGTIVNCYFNDVYYQSHDEAYETPDEDYYEFDFRSGASAYICQGAFNSIINMRSEDYAPRVPTLSAYNSEISFNYKWTKTDTDDYTTFWGKPYQNVSPYSVAYYSHCYISGKIDVSEGEGTWHMTCQNFSWRGYIDSEDTIFNIQVITGGNCTLDRLYINCTAASDALFVINNGNSMSLLNTIVESAGVTSGITFQGTKTLKEDLKNKDWLNDLGFNFIDDDDFRYPQYVDTPDKTTLWVWRKSNYVNHSVPFLPFWYYPVVIPPVYRGDVYEAEYICIYDLTTQQNEFTGHGLAILRPSSCRVVEELNGAYNLTLTHPKDNEGRWQYILEMNIIKCMGQLFVIQRVDEVLSGGSYYVTAYAEHISYTLNDRWIFPPVTIAGYHGSTIMASILEQSTDMGGDWQTQYTFTVSSDIDAPEEFRDWYEMSDGVTPYEMLLGSNGFIAKLGGELYRDNFTLRINERMYGAQDKAFELAMGYNLSGIKRTVDLTTFCTYFRGYDVSDGEYGTWFAISYDPSTLPRAYPRNVVRSKNFSYDHEEYKEGQLERDCFAFWGQNCAPLITYELNVKDLKRVPEYKDFANNYRFKVGDKGRVWDERMQSWVEVEITRTEKDGITGECTKVVIGSQRSFTRPNSYTPFVPVQIDADKILEGIPPLMFSGDGTNLKHCIIYGNEDGVGEVTAVTVPAPTTTHYDTETGSADSETGYYSAGMIAVNAGWTYTAAVEYETTGSQLTYEVLYYASDSSFISSETASTAADSYMFTVPTGAQKAIIQAATEDVVSDFGVTYINIPITINSQTINKNLASKLYANDSVDYTDIPTYNGENTLDIDVENKPSVKIQYKEPIDHDINKTLEGTLPLTINANGQNLTNWILWGAEGGVGSASPNLFNVGLNNDRYRSNNGQKNGTSTDYITSADYVPCEPSTTYSFLAHITGSMSFVGQNFYVYEYDENKNFVKYSSQRITKVSPNESMNNIFTMTTQATTAYVIISWYVSGSTTYLNLDTVKDYMWYLGDTKKDYSPYGGGQISIIVTSGNNSTTVDIPITELLEAGQTISLTTSGVNIPTYNGINTITVTSEVQPEKMKIQYQEPLS